MRYKMKMVSKLFYKIGLLFLVSLFFVFCKNKDSQENYDVRPFGINNIVETGELAAVNSKAFVLPRYGRYWFEMRIIGLLEHGAIVNAGDSIIQIDPADIKKSIIDWESNLETERANLEKLHVDQENRKMEQESKWKNEIASFNLKQIELDASRFETDRLRKIKELEFEQAKITLAKEKKKMELDEIISANEYKIQQIRVRQIENRINHAYDILPELTIRTPISGVFQIAWNRRTNALVTVGDNLYPGNTMANVPELSRMKVNTFINENDFLKIKLGQKVAIRLDAMPNIVFDGEIAYIGKLCRLKNWNQKEKGFDVEVEIPKPDERLKPGMTVSCEFLADN